MIYPRRSQPGVSMTRIALVLFGLMFFWMSMHIIRQSLDVYFR